MFPRVNQPVRLRTCIGIISYVNQAAGDDHTVQLVRVSQLVSSRQLMRIRQLSVSTEDHTAGEDHEASEEQAAAW